MPRAFSLILILILILPAPSHAADVLENVGIIPGNIWYSNYPLQGGVEVRVYTAVFNGSVYSIEGRVSFTDNGQAISKAPFLIPPGQLNEVSIAWVPAQGNHKVSAAITEIKTITQGKPAEPAKLDTVVTAQGTVSVAPPPPPPPLPKTAPLNPVPQVAAATSTKGALTALQASTAALDTFASTSLSKVVAVATSVVPPRVLSPVANAAQSVSNFARATGVQVEQSREAVRASLAAQKARDGTASLSQSSAIARFAPLRWLASLYDGATNTLASWVLGDLPSKVTAAAASSGSGVKKPFEYLWFFLLTIVAFILNHLWLFWLLLLVIFLWFLRLLYRKLLRRDSYGY